MAVDVHDALSPFLNKESLIRTRIKVWGTRFSVRHHTGVSKSKCYRFQSIFFSQLLLLNFNKERNCTFLWKMNDILWLLAYFSLQFWTERGKKCFLTPSSPRMDYDCDLAIWEMVWKRTGIWNPSQFAASHHCRAVSLASILSRGWKKVGMHTEFSPCRPVCSASQVQVPCHFKSRLGKLLRGVSLGKSNGNRRWLKPAKPGLKKT